MSRQTLEKKILLGLSEVNRTESQSAWVSRYAFKELSKLVSDDIVRFINWAMFDYGLVVDDITTRTVIMLYIAYFSGYEKAFGSGDEQS